MHAVSPFDETVGKYPEGLARGAWIRMARSISSIFGYGNYREFNT